MARWAIAAASMLAAFQMWLWGIQGYWLGAFVAFVTMVALGHAAWRPDSAYARSLLKARVLQRSADESERAYWFRVSLAWVLVAVGCLVAALGLPYLFGSAGDFVNLLAALLLAIFLASICMALQSFLYCLFQKGGAPPPDAAHAGQSAKAHTATCAGTRRTPWDS